MTSLVNRSANQEHGNIIVEEIHPVLQEIGLGFFDITDMLASGYCHNFLCQEGIGCIFELICGRLVRVFADPAQVAIQVNFHRSIVLEEELVKLSAPGWNSFAKNLDR